MRLIISRGLIVSIIAVLIGVSPTLAVAQSAELDKVKTLETARDHYYNLRKLGLSEVQVALQPNWDVLLAGTDPAPSTKALLNGLHFWVSIDPAGKLKLSHDAKGVPANQVESIEKIFRGMNGSVTSFFGTWSIFLLSSPFPAPGSDYAVERRPDGFRFSQRQDQLDVAIDTDQEFAITEIKVTTAGLTSSLKPVLETTPAGLVLKGYTASSVRADGRNTSVSASLEYQTVDGLRLLQKVKLDTVFQGAAAKFEWAFADYQVKMR